METKNGIPAFYPKTRKQWRAWLTKNSQKEKAVLLILYHKKSIKPSINYDEAIEEALCFGWIDTKGMKRDDESSYLTITPRKPKGNWSLPNKQRVEAMIKQGFMTPAGQAMIDLAKQSGTWDALSSVQNLTIPDDLQKLFDKKRTALKNFEAFAPSSKKIILQWILSAKRPETRKQRIDETVELAGKNIRAHHILK